MDKVSELLSAMVRDESEAADRLGAEISEAMWRGTSGSILNAAFYLITNRRFRDRPLEEVLGWVAALRARLGEDADEIDPRYAEWLIRGATRNEVALVEQIDPKEYVPLQLLLTAQLALQEHLTQAGLATFLDEAEKLAAKWESDE